MRIAKTFPYGKILRSLKHIEKKLERQDLIPSRRKTLERDFELLKKRIPKLVYSPALHRNIPYRRGMENQTNLFN